MTTLEEKTLGKKMVNKAMKGAAASLTLAVAGELIGSRALMYAGIGALAADVLVVSYYGLYRTYLGQDSDIMYDSHKR